MYNKNRTAMSCRLNSGLTLHFNKHHYKFPNLFRTTLVGGQSILRILISVFLTTCIATGYGILGSQYAYAAPIVIVDDAGPDDEPGQKDLNQLTVDFDSGIADIVVSWNWDVISVSGANTGDACSLYDTDNDGNANFSLCVIWDNGATYQTTRLYVCGDGAADKCDQPRDLLADDFNGDGDLLDVGEAFIGGPYASTCSLTTVADTFGTRGGAQADTDSDTQATCEIELDDFGGGDAFLINVCSYPSQVPGSDPSDCVVAPNSGFLTIIKQSDPDDGTEFTFNLAPPANNGDSMFTIMGSGSIDLISAEAGDTYDLTEIIPQLWQLESGSCLLSDGSPTGTFSDPTVDNFEIQVGRETTCTFVNSPAGPPEGFFTVIKSNDANDDGTFTGEGVKGPDSETIATLPQDVIFKVEIINGSSFSATIDSISDNMHNTFLTGANSTCDELIGTGLAANSSTTCTFIVPFGVATAGSSITNIITVQLTAGSTIDTDTDPSTVVVPELPTLTLIKSVTNDNGGDAGASEWTLTATGNGGFSGNGVPNGDDSQASLGPNSVNPDVSYTLSESGPDGYTASDWVCVGDGTQNGSEITLSLGESVTCTIVNDDVPAMITLIKDVMNDNGGNATENDFGLTTGGVAVSSGQKLDVDANVAIALNEAGLDGYNFVSITGDGCPATLGGEVTLNEGESLTCTIKNDDQPPSLTLVKVVFDLTAPNNMGDPTLFTLTATGPTSISGAGGVTSDTTFSAGIYGLSETNPGGFIAGDWSCTGDGTQTGASITLGLGENATCTINNITLADLCELGKPSTIWVLYDGDPDSMNSQSGNEVIIDPINADFSGEDMVYIEVFDHRGPNAGALIFAGDVDKNVPFEIEGRRRRIPPRMTFLIYSMEDGDLLQTVQFHTSCSQPLFAGDEFGGVTIVGGTHD